MNGVSYELILDGEWDLFIAENKAVAEFADAIASKADLTAHGLTSIAGKVPGNFELDMMRAGLIPDLFYGKNILLAQDLENRHLWYCTTFDFAGKPAVPTVLRFNGVDTVADYYLNGEKIGSSDNMLVEHSFPVFPRVGKNELLVHIKPTVLEARKRVFEAGILKYLDTNAAGVSVRKSPHSFGWDIMPRVVSGGIWKSVALYQFKENRVEELYPMPAFVRDGTGGFFIYCRVGAAEDDIRRYRLVIRGTCGDSVFSWESTLWHTEVKAQVDIPDPKLWWPAGMGEQNLYTVTASLYLDGELVDEFSRRAGLRVVELHSSEILDENRNGEFYFTVNGQKFYPRGSNWVPLDAFHSRDRENLPRALELARGCHCNMLRVWGGNVYESDEFYDYCDEHGIAVWQDFCMACSYYPQTAEFCEAMRTEAEKVILRLRAHPSLVVWAGDNENDWAIQDGRRHPRQNPNDNLLTRKVIPEALRRLDPFRVYLPSSPYISQSAYERSADTPEHHPWGPRGYYKDAYYLSHTDHFLSEIGYHGCPSVSSVKKFISPANLWHWEKNGEWILHAANMTEDPRGQFAYRIPLMAKQIAHLFGKDAETLDEFALLSQITQAEADKFFIESNRLRKWKNGSGIFFWNVIDGWPQFSDAVVDYYGVKKLAYFVIRNTFEAVSLMCREPENGSLTLAGANDTLADVPVSYVVENLTDGGTVAEGDALLRANCTEDICKFACPAGRTVFYRITWQRDGETHENHYLLGSAPVDRGTVLDGYRKMGLLDHYTE